MADKQITLIGCGKMGSAMLEGWLGDVSLDARFNIIEPDHSQLGWVTMSLVCRCMKITPPPFQAMRQPAQ